MVRPLTFVRPAELAEYAELAKPLRDIIHSYDKKSKADIEHEWEHETKGATAKRALEVLK